MTPYKIISADSHIMEPPELWVERIGQAFGDFIKDGHCSKKTGCGKGRARFDLTSQGS